MDAKEVLANQGFNMGRLIAVSKSGYKSQYPNNEVVFNANIVTSEGKVWYGDLDLTLDR